MQNDRWLLTLLTAAVLVLSFSGCSDDDGEEEGPEDKKVTVESLTAKGFVGARVSQMRIDTILGKPLEFEDLSEFIGQLGYPDCESLPSQFRFRVREWGRGFTFDLITPQPAYRNGFRQIVISEPGSPSLNLEIDCQEKSVINY
ncbi:MAG: hypothetical protein IT288_04720 [Bdellovibrionales bacterium]|nr:hypothetical protein [Bdellovibrionales bacterium]